MLKLTDYQESQLMHIHFVGELKYTTDEGTKVPRPTWRKMIDVLRENELAVLTGRVRLTDKGRKIVEAIHQRNIQ